MIRINNRIAVTGKGSDQKIINLGFTGGGSNTVTSTTQDLTAAIQAINSRHEVTANLGLGPQGGMSGISLSSTGANSKNLDTTLFGFIDEKNGHRMRIYYRDMYNYDPVAGSAVDLISTLPFSDYTLTGANTETLSKFVTATERLNLQTVAPEISVTYLVDGEFIGSLVYNGQLKTFTDLMPYNSDDATVTEMPLYSMDPVIKCKTSKAIKDFLASNEEFVVSARNQLPGPMLDALQSGSFTLDPVTTIYMPRRVTPDGKPVSYLRRLLPIYLLEKHLLRGTIAEAAKRQRGPLHAAVGDENWIPTPLELQAINAALQQTDLDPLGPVITTRGPVQMQEIRPGGEFWKITDVWDTTSPMKMRALSLSETFLSGEATYNTAEISLSVFIEGIRSYRDYFTHRIFYNRVFPIIAAVNGFKTKSKQQAGDLNFAINDNSQYIIPTVTWHKSLQPHNDRDTMDMLATLDEKGVPVLLKMYAAAGGVTMENLMKELDDDLKMRTDIAKYKAKLEAISGGDQGGDSGGDIGDMGVQESSSLILPTGVRRNKSPVWTREFGSAAELVGRTVTGKARYIHNQRDAKRKQNAAIVKALDNMSDPNYYAQVRQKITASLRRDHTF